MKSKGLHTQTREVPEHREDDTSSRSESFDGNEELCSCGRAPRRRSSKRRRALTCAICHCEAQRRYYARYRRRYRELEALVGQVNGNNPATRARFWERFKHRHVIYRATEHDSVDDFNGIVTGFLPRDRVILTTLGGVEYQVPLDRLVADWGYKEINSDYQHRILEKGHQKRHRRSLGLYPEKGGR